MSEFYEGFKMACQILAFTGGFLTAVTLAWLAVGQIGDAFRNRLMP
jgi:hypothetical protein